MERQLLCRIGIPQQGASNLANTTIGFGIVLIVLGLGGYFGTDRVSLTALIPAAFGLLLVIFGALARDEKRRKMAMHIAVTVGLLGFLGTVFTMISRGALEKPAALISQSIMAVLMAVYVGMCVKSFIDARRRRAGA
jgi:O-antigen/teichoic acid export membrane protein